MWLEDHQVFKSAELLSAFIELVEELLLVVGALAGYANADLFGGGLFPEREVVGCWEASGHSIVPPNCRQN